MVLRLVIATHKSIRASVRTALGIAGSFVGLHQGSAVSNFLFVVILDTISASLRQGVKWQLRSVTIRSARIQHVWYCDLLL